MIWAAAIMIAVGLVALGVLVVLGWGTARRVVRPRRSRPTAIHEVTSDRVVLDSTPLSRFSGPMGLLYDDERAHIPLGDVLAADDRSVSRTIPQVAKPPQAGRVGRVVGDVFGSPSAAGLIATEGKFDTSAGGAPYWLLGEAAGAASSLWAIHVHGAMSERSSMLRTARTFADLGATSIVITYRGDSEYGSGRNRVSTLGQDEWRDLEAAVQLARERGAERIVLVGMSLGATIVLRFLNMSGLASTIGGVVLVAPILDWRSTIRASVKTAGLPVSVSWAAMRLLSWPLTARLLGLTAAIRFDELDFTKHGELPTPALVIHCEGDRVAPHRCSQDFKARHGHRVMLQTIPANEHALEWNWDPTHFTEVAGRWLSEATPV